MTEIDKKGKKIILFTHQFPFGHVENFLEEELCSLQKAFDEIIIVPNQLGTLHRSLPAGVKIEESFARSYHSTSPLFKWKRLWTSLKSEETYRELRGNFSLLFKPKHLKSLLYFASQSEFYYLWLTDFLSKNPKYKESLFYTYWLHVQAHGIHLVKRRDYPALRHISRAHSFEIYLEDYDPSYIPFRRRTLPTVDAIYTISDHGGHRLLKDHGTAINRICTSRLGVKDPQFLNPDNTDHSLTLVSTSFLVPEKRIDLIIAGLKELKERRRFDRITWHHFGDGPLKSELTRLAIEALGHDVDWIFHGHVTNRELLEFYRKTPIDGFINTSRTEGIPVSIMEAQSCGIATIATDVGAVAEIVNPEVGVLLPKNPTPHQIADALISLGENKERLRQQRRNARENWRQLYNAQKNFDSFADELLTWYQSPTSL